MNLETLHRPDERGKAIKKWVTVFILSILFIIGSTEFGLAQPDEKVRGEIDNGKLYLDIGLKSGYLRGDTSYSISFAEGESELKFSLKTFLLGIEGGWGYRNPQKQDKLRLSVKWLTNIDHGSGKMEDSDWIEGDGHPGLDIYSESDIESKAHIVDVNVIYNFWLIKQLSIGPIVGYRFQYFKYDVSNTDQVGYGPWAPVATVYVSGKTLNYKIEYHIPYFGLNSNVLFGKKLQANMRINYSPLTFARDRDDHLLRYKLSKGDTDGYAYIASIDGTWNFLPNWSLTIGDEYLKIRTTGTQYQVFYGGPFIGTTYDVDDKITSSQLFISAIISFRF
jgi:outer membrane protease